MPISETCRTCERCDEDVIVVTVPGMCMARPRRTSHCKLYKALMPGRTCRSFGPKPHLAADNFEAGVRAPSPETLVR